MKNEGLQIFSPHDEDGITIKLITRLYKDSPLFYVELGAPSAGIVSCTRILRTRVPYVLPVLLEDPCAYWMTTAKHKVVYNRGDLLEPVPGNWSGLTLDKYNENPRIDLYREPGMTPDTIVPLLKKHGVPPHIHLLSIRAAHCDTIVNILLHYICDILIYESADALFLEGYLLHYKSETTCFYVRASIFSESIS